MGLGTAVGQEWAPRSAMGSRCKHLLFGVWIRSRNGALLLLAKGVTPLLHNHSRRVRFPTTLCTLSRGRSLSIPESDGVNRSIPPPPTPTPTHSVGFVWSKWSWNGVFSLLLQVSLFPQFERIIVALRCALRHAGVALLPDISMVSSTMKKHPCRCGVSVGSNDNANREYENIRKVRGTKDGII